MTNHTKRMEKIDRVLALVRAEVERAIQKHKNGMNSPHEGYSVIAEELDELWDEVKADRGRQRSAFEEAVQVAAMGIRYVADLDTSL